MDVWEHLYDHSPLGPGHDAWEHLVAAEGGSGFVLIDTVEVEVMSPCIDVEIENPDIEIEIESAIEIEIENPDIDVEVECV